MAHRLIQLRYPARCSSCTIALVADTRAWWDTDAKCARCQTCGVLGNGPADAMLVPVADQPVRLRRIPNRVRMILPKEGLAPEAGAYAHVGERVAGGT